MHTIYKPTVLYLIKILGLIVFVVAAAVMIGIFFDVPNFLFKSQWYERAILFFCVIMILLGSYFTIVANNPTIICTDSTIHIGVIELSYDEIDSFFESKGGSEPYVLTKDQERIDLQLSWFTKKDQIEITTILKEKIGVNTFTT